MNYEERIPFHEQYEQFFPIIEWYKHTTHHTKLWICEQWDLLTEWTSERNMRRRDNGFLGCVSSSGRKKFQRKSHKGSTIKKEY